MSVRPSARECAFLAWTERTGSMVTSMPPPTSDDSNVPAGGDLEGAQPAPEPSQPEMVTSPSRPKRGSGKAQPIVLLALIGVFGLLQLNALLVSAAHQRWAWAVTHAVILGLLAWGAVFNIKKLMESDG